MASEYNHALDLHTFIFYLRCSLEPLGVPGLLRTGKSALRSARKTSCEVSLEGYVFLMGWQETVALSIVTLTAGVFLWSRFRPRRFSFARTGHCGCASPNESSSRQSIVFRARRGERPQVVFKAK